MNEESEQAEQKKNDWLYRAIFSISKDIEKMDWVSVMEGNPTAADADDAGNICVLLKHEATGGRVMNIRRWDEVADPSQPEVFAWKGMSWIDERHGIWGKDTGFAGIGAGFLSSQEDLIERVWRVAAELGIGEQERQVLEREFVAAETVARGGREGVV